MYWLTSSVSDATVPPTTRYSVSVPCTRSGAKTIPTRHPFSRWFVKNRPLPPSYLNGGESTFPPYDPPPFARYEGPLLRGGRLDGGHKKGMKPRRGASFSARTVLFRGSRRFESASQWNNMTEAWSLFTDMAGEGKENGERRARTRGTREHWGRRSPSSQADGRRGHGE